MKKIITIITVFVIGFLFFSNSFAQEAGDYRSAANGDWSSAATWEEFNGTTWEAALAAPDGSENITITDSVSADIAVAVTGYIIVEGDGLLSIGAGSLTFDDGSTYEHARNNGDIPESTWNSGSTCLITGVTNITPGNSDQDFYNFTWDCSGQDSNLDVSWSGNTIGGDVTVSNTGTNQLRLTSSSDYEDSITINGDIILSDGLLTATGSSTAMEYTIVVNGSINVTGGSFALSRGSGGNAAWYVGGDLSVSNAEIRSSNPDAKFLFYGDTVHNLSYSSISYNGTVNYELDVDDTLEVVDGPDETDFPVEDTFTNYGQVNTTGTMAFLNGSVYNHAVNGGNVPIAEWNTGSTCMFTGIVNEAPGNRNQDFYHFVWDCPDQDSNLNMGWNGNTIGGNITTINTGSNRWYLCGPQTDSTVSVTINGDIIHQDGQFASQGTGNGNTHVIVNHFGNIKAFAGNFSIGRGSQGNGSGTVSWFFHGDSLILSDLTTQNSNPLQGAAKFIISDTTALVLTNVSYGGGGFPVEVDTSALLNMGESIIRGSGYFAVNSNGSLGTGNAGGLDSALQNTGTRNLSQEGNYIFNGSAAQITGVNLPDTLNNMEVNNAAGVTLSASVEVSGNLNIVNGDLDLNGNTITLGSSAALNETPGNTVTGTSGMLTTTRDINAPGSLNIAGLGAELTSSADLGSTTIERIHSAAAGRGNEGIFRQFNISPANNSSLDATLRFHYDESELNGIPEANLILFKSASGDDDTWAPMAGIVNADENYVELSGISDFSYWTLADVENPVPVELTSFTAAVDGQNVNLKWVTATEVNNRGFDIEKKIKEEWEVIGFVEGNGNKLEATSYSYSDKDVNFGKYQYRLKQIDFDGRVEFSDVIEVEVNAPKEFTLHQNFPNPFNPETVIRFELPQESFVNISVYNSIGEKVATIINEKLDIGVHTKTFNASSFSSGIYIYRLTTDNHVFTKKMMLIK